MRIKKNNWKISLIAIKITRLIKNLINIIRKKIKRRKRIRIKNWRISLIVN